MRRIASLSASDRAALFNETGIRMGLPPFHVEKDFWVCWTLATLFGSDTLRPKLTFRGGTSLSKGWGLIERFSEDIDLSMARAWFPEAKDPTDTSITKSERERRLKTLRQECRRGVSEVIAPVLYQAAEGLPGKWQIEVESLDQARDPFCIHFIYPGTEVVPPASYHRAAVKIELSGRAEGWPMEERIVIPYVAQEFPDIDPAATLRLSCVGPERTFWEKAALIHEQNTRPGNKPMAPRQARHLYDLFQLWGTLPERGDWLALFDGVIAHRKSYYNYEWVDYDTLVPGSLRLVPAEENLAEWRADYQAMREMFFAEPPSFEEIISGLKGIENSFK